MHAPRARERACEVRSTTSRAQGGMHAALRRRGAAQALLLLSTVAAAPSKQLSRISLEYERFVVPPHKLSSSSGAFIMNPMHLGEAHGHVQLVKRLAAGLGIPSVRVSGIQAAEELRASGAPFVYITLTNDHQHRTHAAHNRTLRWERSLGDGADASTVRLIGPPGGYIDESRRKIDFCAMSEQLWRRHADRSLRFSLK